MQWRIRFASGYDYDDAFETAATLEMALIQFRAKYPTAYIDSIVNNEA